MSPLNFTRYLKTESLTKVIISGGFFDVSFAKPGFATINSPAHNKLTKILEFSLCVFVFIQELCANLRPVVPAIMRLPAENSVKNFYST